MIRFRLRTALGAFVALSLLFAWFGSHWRDAHREQQAVEKLSQLGGSVAYDYEFNGEDEPPGHPRLRRWLGDHFFAHVEAVDFFNRDDPFGTINAGDEALSHVGCFPHLKRLGLSQTQVTDDGLRHLTNLQQLEELDLSETRIGDSGLVYVGKLQNLRELYLLGTKVTDDGIMHLRTQQKLENVWLWRSAVTDQGVKRLQTALPQCNVNNG